MDLKNPKLIYLKAILFVLIGLLASVLLLIDSPTGRTAVLLALAVWGFARAHYFAFYVIQHYIDPGFKFAGILSFVWYVFRRKNKDL